MKKSHLTYLACALTALSLGVAAQAADLTVVGSVDKTNGSVKYLTPRSIEVLNSQQISNTGAQNLDQVFKYTTGTTASLYGNDLDDAIWFRVRGFEAKTTLDGNNIFSGNYNTPNFSLFGVEKLELVKGADATTYGNSVTGGVVNLITKRPHFTKQSLVSVKLGNYENRGIAWDTQTLLAPNSGFRFVFETNHRNGQVNGTWLERTYLAPSLSHRFSENTDVTLLASFQRDKGVPTTNFYPVLGTLDTSEGRISPFTNLGNPHQDYIDRRQFTLGYELNHRFASSFLFQSNFKYYSDRRNQLVTHFASTTKLPTASQGSLYVNNEARSFNLDNRVTYSFADKASKFYTNLTAGVETSKFDYDGIYGFGVGSSLNVLNPVYSYYANNVKTQSTGKGSQIGFYLKGDLQYAGLRANFGVRHDKAYTPADTAKAAYYNVNKTSKSLGLMYVADNGLSPYASYSESFTPIAGVKANGSAYKPVSGKQTEVGIKYQPEELDAKFGIAYFNINEKNTLVYNSNYIAEQVGKKESRGLELSAEVQLTDAFKLDAGYTLTKAKTFKAWNDATIVADPLTPKHQAFVRGVYSIADTGLDLGLAVRYKGKTDGLDSAGKSYAVKAVTLVDASAAYKINDQWSASLQVNNLFNKTYVNNVSYYAYYGEKLNVQAQLNYAY